MKKLMVAAAAACLAAFAQGAAVAWNTGVVAKPSEYGTGNATTKARGYAFEISQEKYAEILALGYTAGAAEIYDTYKDSLGSASLVMDNGKGGGNKMSSGEGVFNQELGASAQKAYAFLFEYLDADSKVSHYMGNVGMVTINEYGNDANIQQVATVWGTTSDGAGSANMTWLAATDVPEPTSGLLLLLGVAGLALKRKRA